MAIPIWKDHSVTIGTAEDVEYSIYLGSDNTGALIYTGKAYRKPGASSVSVRINDICTSYLRQSLSLLFSSEDDSIDESAALRQTFSIYAGTKVEEVEFFYCWDYETSADPNAALRHYPIVDHIQPGMRVPLTVNRTMVAGDLEVSAYIGGTETDSYTNTETGPVNMFLRAPSVDSGRLAIMLTEPFEASAHYTMVPACHRWALYYVNAAGAWDVLLIEGKDRKTDIYKPSSYRRDYDNASELGRGEVVYLNDITRTWELHTGWLTDAQAGRMHHLLGSTLVYLCDLTDDSLRPVAITNKDCPTKTHKDGMVSYRIDVRLQRDIIRR